MFVKFTNIDMLVEGIDNKLKEKKELLNWYKLKVRQISQRAA